MEEIRQLAARYAVAIDSRNLDMLISLYVEDVYVGKYGRGRQALRRSFEDGLRDLGVSILNVGTHMIDLLDGDHATGIVYCKGEIQRGDRWIHQAIGYRDTYERREGTWYFVRRIHELFYGVDVTPNPLQQAPANWPESSTGRGTLPESWPSWGEFWAPRA